MQQWLWAVRPAPESILLLGLAAGIALYLRRLMLRRGSFTRMSANVLTPILAMAILPALALVWSVGLMTPVRAPIPFDRNTWAAKPWVRWRMADDVADRYLLVGMTRQQVLALLGDPNGSVGEDGWSLERPQDSYELMPSELTAYYDERDRLTNWAIEPGFWQAVIDGAEPTRRGSEPTATR